MIAAHLLLRGTSMTEVHQIDFRRVRILAAVVLAVGSASVGFLGGWLSARLVSAGPQLAAIADREAPAQAASPAEPPKAEDARQDTSAASMTGAGASSSAQQATAAPDGQRAGSTEKAADPGKADKGRADTANASDSQKVEETHKGATIINASSADRNAAPSRNPPNADLAKAPSLDTVTDRASDRPDPDAAVGRSADQDVLERCARKYSSFRASDGTYQPYDGGPRKLCSLLR